MQNNKKNRPECKLEGLGSDEDVTIFIISIVQSDFRSLSDISTLL